MQEKRDPSRGESKGKGSQARVQLPGSQGGLRKEGRGQPGGRSDCTGPVGQGEDLVLPMKTGAMQGSEQRRDVAWFHILQEASWLL